MRILLVEDHPDVARSMAMLLEMMGHTVHHAGTGNNAITEAPIFKPDLMMVDIGLPDMDGFSVARAMRSTPQFAKTVMVALTGFDCEDKCKEAGFTHYYKKPMAVEDMERLLAAKAA